MSTESVGGPLGGPSEAPQTTDKQNLMTESERPPPTSTSTLTQQSFISSATSNVSVENSQVLFGELPLRSSFHRVPTTTISSIVIQTGKSRVVIAVIGVCKPFENPSFHFVKFIIIVSNFSQISYYSKFKLFFRAFNDTLKKENRMHYENEHEILWSTERCYLNASCSN